MNRLKIERLSVKLGGRRVLEDIHLEAEAGAFIVLLGPNGAGKTTLLRAIAGLVPIEGTIILEGTDAADLSAQEKARRIGYLPQGHLLHWPLPVWDVVALGRYPRGARDPRRLAGDDRRAVEEALIATDMLGFADRQANHLSGGERARVALARVLALQADILLADEPTASLDPRHQIEVMERLAKTAAAGVLVIVVMHDLVLASRYAQRVIVLDGGRIAGDGPPAAALDEDRLRQVFHIEAARLTHDGQALALPWRTL